MGQRPVWAGVAVIGLLAVAGCGDDQGQVEAGNDDQPEVSAGGGGYASVEDLAARLGCELDGIEEWEQEDLNYMAPVRSDTMTDAVICRLEDDETINVFYRPAERGPLTTDELSHAFTHPTRDPEAQPPPSAPDCSPWLIIGEHWVVQVGSDHASEVVRDTLGSEVQRAEPSARTPVSLRPPGPCRQS